MSGQAPRWYATTGRQSSVVFDGEFGEVQRARTVDQQNAVGQARQRAAAVTTRAEKNAVRQSTGVEIDKAAAFDRLPSWMHQLGSLPAVERLGVIESCRDNPESEEWAVSYRR